LDQIVLCVIPR